MRRASGAPSASREHRCPSLAWPTQGPAPIALRSPPLRGSAVVASPRAPPPPAPPSPCGPAACLGEVRACNLTSAPQSRERGEGEGGVRRNAEKLGERKMRRMQCEQGDGPVGDAPEDVFSWEVARVRVCARHQRMFQQLRTMPKDRGARFSRAEGRDLTTSRYRAVQGGESTLPQRTLPTTRARSSAVSPSASCASGRAPPTRSAVTHWTCPAAAARCSARRSPHPRSSGDAPAFRSSLTASTLPSKCKYQRPRRVGLIFAHGARMVNTSIFLQGSFGSSDHQGQD
jgi:hypothetical protein